MSGANNVKMQVENSVFFYLFISVTWIMPAALC